MTVTDGTTTDGTGTSGGGDDLLRIDGLKTYFHTDEGTAKARAVAV